MTLLPFAMLFLALALLLISLEFLILTSAREYGRRADLERRRALAAYAERARYASECTRARYASECTRARNVRAMEKRVRRRQRTRP